MKIKIKAKNKDSGAKGIDSLGNSTDVMKRSLFNQHQHDRKLKKTQKENQKKMKYPRYHVNIFVFVPFDSIKCNFGTRHKPCSITEEENFTRTPPGLMSKKRKDKKRKRKEK